MENNNILFGIVCFREDFKETVVFKDLIRSYNYWLENFNTKDSVANDLNIYIYDNTDVDKWDLSVFKSEKNISVYYEHDKNNSGISFAYNTIGDYAKKNGYSHIVFLDQDTRLPDVFYKVYLEASLDCDIAIPTIYENSKLISPSKYKFYRSSLYKFIPDSPITVKGNTCINSGILVNTDFFLLVGGYHPKLRLDFCDHEFISRVGNFSEYLKIIPIKLEQNFSTNTNSEQKALFRYKLFVCDMTVFKKINNNFLVTLFVDAPHLLRLTWQYRSLKFIKHRLIRNKTV